MNAKMTNLEYLQLIVEKNGPQSYCPFTAGEVLDMIEFAASMSNAPDEADKLHEVVAALVDPRTPAQICDDEQDADYQATIAGL